MTIAVTGGTGFVGQALLDLAGQEGVSVQALTRRPQADREGVVWVRGALDDARALAELTAGCETVIHIAGVVNSDVAGFEAGNVAGTQALVHAAAGAGVRRLVHVSSLAAREPQLSAYGASKLRGERAVRLSRLDWTILRPPAIYGPRDREMLDLFRMAKRGIVPLPPAGHLSVIHVADLARLLLALGPGGEDVSGQVFEADDGKPGGWRHKSFARALGRAVGRRVLPLPVPVPVLRLGAGIDGLVRGRAAKLTPDRVGYMAHADWRADPAASPPVRRWQPGIDTPAGLAATAEWYRAAGWL